MGLPAGMVSWFALCAGTAGICGIGISWILKLKQSGESDETLTWLLPAASALGGFAALLIAMKPAVLFLSDQVHMRFRSGIPVLAGVTIGCLAAATISLLRRRPDHSRGVDFVTVGVGLLFAVLAQLLLMLETLTASAWAFRLARGEIGIAVGAVIAGAAAGLIYRIGLRKQSGLGALIVNELVSVVAVILLWRQVN